MAGENVAAKYTTIAQVMRILESWVIRIVMCWSRIGCFMFQA